MSDPQAERARVTPLELFFDLVFVFAITQVTTFLARIPTWGGLLRGLLLKTTLAFAEEGSSLATIPAIGLCGGLALYMLAHVLVRLRLGGGLGRGRPIATVVLVAMIPVTTHIPPLAALATVTAVCVVLIAYEVLRHRASRAWIRTHRDGFTLGEAREVTEPERRPRRARRRR